MVSVHEMQFGLMPEKRTTDVLIFIGLRQRIMLIIIIKVVYVFCAYIESFCQTDTMTDTTVLNPVISPKLRVARAISTL